MNHTARVTRAALVDDALASVDNTLTVHRTTRVSFFACARGWKELCARFMGVRWSNPGLCTIHSPYYLYYRSTDPLSRKGTL